MPWIQQQLIADGITAEGRVVVPKAILETIINTQVLTLAVNAGGTGYVVGETFDLFTGTAVAVNGASILATGRVVAEAAGVVSAVEILSAGAYPSGTQPTASAGATTNASLAGNDDLTVDVTMQANQYTQDSSDYVNLLTNFEWICSSIKAANAPTIGMRSRLSASNDGMQFLTASSYDLGSTWLAQPGAPPTNEMYMALPNQDPILYLSVTDRRVNVMVTDGTFKQYAGVGLFIPFTDVAANYPFPGFCHGNARSVLAFNSNRGTTNSGIVNPIDPGAAIGCYQYRDNLSPSWFGISLNNSVGGEVAVAQLWPAQDADTLYDFNHAPVPAGSSVAAGSMNPFSSTMPTGSFEDDENSTGWFRSNQSSGGPQGIAPLGPGGQMHYTVQPHIISNQTDVSQPIGVLDGWEAIHGRGLNAFDEVATEGGQRYLVFNETNTPDLWRWVAMEKL